MTTCKTVYFIRHGQSADSATRQFQSPDTPLTELGKVQAKKIAERLLNIPFDTLISSTFQRAKETAHAIEKATGKKAEFSDLFIERMKPTSVINKPYDDIEANTNLNEWKKSLHTPGMRVLDGENFEDIISRADRALDFLQNREDEKIVVVTHGYFLRTLLARILLKNTLSAESFKNFHRHAIHENTGLTIFHYDTQDALGWHLKTFNDDSHLN